MINRSGNSIDFNTKAKDAVSRKVIIAAILGVALVAFEIFNFDTTQYALSNLLGEVRFGGIMWATILAIAFCAIDFAGLVRIFTPERGREEPKAVWFLLGAWFLGTIANSIMTWWAVSLTLLSHEFGNEVLSREALLRYVPIFVAMLVWLTRILFIGAFSVAGEDMFDLARSRAEAEPRGESPASLPAPKPVRPPVTATATRAVAAPTKPLATPKTPARPPAQPRPSAAAVKSPPAPSRPAVTYEPVDLPFDDYPAAPKTSGDGAPRPNNSRIQQRPPMPGSMGRTPSTGNLQARASDR
jgi:hypothetical protein